MWQLASSRQGNRQGVGDVNNLTLSILFFLFFCFGAAFAADANGQGGANANSADDANADTLHDINAAVVQGQAFDVNAGLDANASAPQPQEPSPASANPGRNASLDINAGVDTNAGVDINAAAVADVNSLRIGPNVSDLNQFIDLNSSRADTNASDLNAGRIDSNVSDLNVAGRIDANVSDLNAVHIDANISDLNSGRIDVNLLGINVALDLNADLDLNANAGLNAQNDQNAIDANATRPEQFTIPDFNFLRLLGENPARYLSTFDQVFLGKIKGFIDSIFDGISGGWQQGSLDANGPAHDLNGLYTVPGLNYFSAIDSNSPPAFGFLSGVKAAIDQFLSGLEQPRPKALKNVGPIDVNVNGIAAKCIGDCDDIPEAVQ